MYFIQPVPVPCGDSDHDTGKYRAFVTTRPLTHYPDPHSDPERLYERLAYAADFDESPVVGDEKYFGRSKAEAVGYALLNLSCIENEIKVVVGTCD